MSSLLIEPGAQPVAGYTLIDRLGRGGFGEVWKATGPGGFQVALKFVVVATGAGATELRALEIIKHIRHPHLLATFGAWEAGDFLILAMELAERTLMDLFRAAEARGLVGIPAPEIVDYFADAARGIDYLNEPRHPSEGNVLIGIQHRDVKPQNLMLVGGSVKVADFGLARILLHTQTSHTGSLTPSYAAPEFFRNQTSRHSDQYSLAVTYCHLRGGRLPFVGSFEQIAVGHLMHPPDLSMLPPGESEIVARALAKAPNERWANCREFVEELRPRVEVERRFQSGSTIVDLGGTTPWTGAERIEEPVLEPAPLAQSQISTVKASPRDRSGRRWVLRGGACLVVFSALVGGVWWNHGDRPKDSPPPKVARPIRLLLPEALALEAGEKANLVVKLMRDDQPGAVALAIPDVPRGLSIRVRPIAAGEDEARVEFSADEEAPAFDGSMRVVGRGDAGAVEGEFRLKIVPCAFGEIRLLEGTETPVTAAIFTPDGQRALTAEEEGTVRLWDVSTGLPLRSSRARTSRIVSLACMADRRRALSLAALDPFAADRGLGLWDLAGPAGSLPKEVPSRGASCLAILPDGRHALLGGGDRTLHSWDVEQAKELRAFEESDSEINCLAASPDGHRVATGSLGGEVSLWDLDTGKILLQFAGHTAEVRAVGFTADGDQILSAAGSSPFRIADNAIRVWDVEKASEVARVQVPGPISRAAFAPDGRRALTGDEGGAIRLWDIPAARELHLFSGHSDRIVSLAIAPDGRRALSASADGTVRLWSLKNSKKEPLRR